MTSYAEFSETAQEHALHPRNHGELARFDGYALLTGVCGDTMQFWIRHEELKAVEVTFDTDGCGASHACGSMATCLAKGMSLNEIECIGQRDILEALGELPERLQHCALLAATTLHLAVADARKANRRKKTFEDANSICNLLAQSLRPRG